MKKARFSAVRVANMTKSSISYLTTNHDGAVTLTNAHDRTILVNIELCLKYLSDFRESGKAATDHQWVKIINSDEPEKHIKLEITPSARLFIKVFQLLVPLKQYREHYKFHPFIETALALKNEYYDVLSVIQSADSHNSIDTFKFINISDFNAAVSTLLGRINTSAHRTNEFNYYRPVFIVIKRKEEKAREIIGKCDHTPYVSVINLLFSHERKYSDTSLQKLDAKFEELSNAVRKLIGKTKRRKSLLSIKGSLVKLQYTKQYGWHAHAAFILDIPKPRFNDALIKRLVKAVVRKRAGVLIDELNQPLEQEKKDKLIKALGKTFEQQKTDTLIERLAKAAVRKRVGVLIEEQSQPLEQKKIDELIEEMNKPLAQEKKDELIEELSKPLDQKIIDELSKGAEQAKIDTLIERLTKIVIRKRVGGLIECVSKTLGQEEIDRLIINITKAVIRKRVIVLSDGLSKGLGQEKIDMLIDELSQPLEQKKIDEIIEGMTKPLEQEKKDKLSKEIDTLNEELSKCGNQEKIDEIIEELTKAIVERVEYRLHRWQIVNVKTVDTLFEVVQQEMAEGTLESVMSIWSSSIDASTLKDKEPHHSIYAHAKVHHPAKSVKKNSLSKMTFFSFNNIFLINGGNLIYPSVESILPLVDLFDSLFLPPCIMQYKDSNKESQRKKKMFINNGW
ncbi:hypothetical protein [Aeromonas veronii]|uniref:Uncharacterized protein n=1 Tax=Aeromonas veronii TaxID=654 RepID=A0A2T4MZ20_AERVE|nr:hypothetical protein [Aeromonas veronii]MCR4450906.1 hypothetical protein [Aeromonas veronii]MCX0445866.1 hypothetical protein [Aeromonas veronii]PTH79840.1 hypothetical protein DAA48_18205 [Aeromonas veronii]